MADRSGSPSLSMARSAVRSICPSCTTRRAMSPVTLRLMLARGRSAGATAGAGTLATGPASIPSTRDLEMAKVFSPTVYSTPPLLSRTESATMRLPFFSLMTSAQTVPHSAARPRNVMQYLNRRNCNKSCPARWNPCLATITLLVGLCLVPGGHALQTAAADDPLTLYRQLLNPGISVRHVYQIRQVALDREDLHVVLIDGQIGLLQAVDCHVTGAFFEGEVEITLWPPDRADRTRSEERRVGKECRSRWSPYH